MVFIFLVVVFVFLVLLFASCVLWFCDFGCYLLTVVGR